MIPWFPRPTSIGGQQGALGKLFGNPAISYWLLLGVGWWWAPRWHIRLRDGWGLRTSWPATPRRPARW